MVTIIRIAAIIPPTMGPIASCSVGGSGLDGITIVV